MSKRTAYDMSLNQITNIYALQNNSFVCLDCDAEARHMYCFSGVGVGVNFVEVLRLGRFLKNYKDSCHQKLGHGDISTNEAQNNHQY